MYQNTQTQLFIFRSTVAKAWFNLLSPFNSVLQSLTIYIYIYILSFYLDMFQMSLWYFLLNIFVCFPSFNTVPQGDYLQSKLTCSSLGQVV